MCGVAASSGTRLITRDDVMKGIWKTRLILIVLAVIVLVGLIVTLLPPAGKVIRPLPPSTPYPTSRQFEAILLTVSYLELEGGDEGFATAESLQAAIRERTRELSVAKTLEPWEMFINPDPSAWVVDKVESTDPGCKEPAIVCRHPKGRGDFVMTFGQAWFIAPEGWYFEAPWLDEAIRPE